MMGPTRVVGDQKRLLANTTTLVFYAKGTACTIQSGGAFNSSADLWVMSIDDGAPVSSGTSSGGSGEKVSTLFTGLADTWHKVVLVAGTGTGTALWVDATLANAIVVTGADPLVIIPQNVETFKGSANALSAGLFKTTTNTDFLPTQVVGQSGTLQETTYGVAGRATFSRLFASCTSDAIYVSIDGAAPTRHAASTPDLGTAVVCGVAVDTVDDAEHTILVWANDTNNANAQISLATQSGEAIALPTANRMYTFGHSIVVGQDAESGAGSTSYNSMAWRNGYLPTIMAKSGYTFVEMNAALPDVLLTVDVAAGDVAVVSLGRNDSTAAMDTTRLAAYNGILDKLVAKGFGQIMCLGAMPDAGFLAAADPGQLNDSIETMVDARGAGDNVVYVDRNNYTAITTVDGVHPNDAGYLEMAALDVVSFDPLLP
jgi:hypothetical protein